MSRAALSRPVPPMLADLQPAINAAVQALCTSAHETPALPVEVVDYVYPRLEQAHGIVVLLLTTIENEQAPPQHFAELFSRCVEMALRQIQHVTNFDAVTSTSKSNASAYAWIDEAYELIALLTVMSAGLYSGGDSFDTEEVVVVNLLAVAQSALESIMSAVGALRA